DLEEPRLEVRSLFELVVVLVGLEVGLLNQILRVLGIPGHAVGGVVERIDVRHGCLLEIPPLLMIVRYGGLHRFSRGLRQKASTSVPHERLDAAIVGLVTTRAANRWTRFLSDSPQ